MNTPAPTPTPWVGRLALANAAALVVVRTILTAPGIAASLRFDPADFPARPWSVVTYPLVHESLLHLTAVTLLLLTIGPTVERRMGGRGFLLYYLYCTTGAALIAMGLASLMPVPAMAGAMAPVLGLAFAFAVFAEDEEVSLEPLPFRAGARVLIAVFGATVLVVGLVARERGLSIAHAGGFAAGWVFFRLRAMRHRPQPERPLPVRRPVMAPIRQQAETPAIQAAVQVRGSRAHLPGEDAEEVNRVLDKISAHGIESLTPEEHHLLTEYSERKRRERS